MKWMGFAVLLIVPLAYVMICGAVFLVQCGVVDRIRRVVSGIYKRLR